MKLKRVKKILLLAIVASIFSISNVKAALPECTTVYPKKDAIATAFNFTISSQYGRILTVSGQTVFSAVASKPPKYISHLCPSSGNSLQSKLQSLIIKYSSTNIAS